MSDDTNLVPAEEIERIVGTRRRQQWHIGHAESITETFFIMHSFECLEEYEDLRECPYSRRLGRHGIDLGIWGDLQDRPVPIILGGDDLDSPNILDHIIPADIPLEECE